MWNEIQVKLMWTNFCFVYYVQITFVICKALLKTDPYVLWLSQQTVVDEIVLNSHFTDEWIR